MSPSFLARESHALVLNLHRYTFIRLLNKGGYGSVYLACTQGNHPVAIKHISLHGLSASHKQTRLQSFRREIRFLATLQHPQLVRYIDCVQQGNDLYLVMEYIEGCTLEEYIEECGGALPLDEVLDIGIQLCEILEYLHQLDPPLIFRDLKPANVMRRPDGRIVLIDFGIARFYKEGQTSDTQLLGSPGYCAPEQHGLAQSDERSDLFALGATLYTLLTGKIYAQPPSFSFPRLYWPSDPVGNRLGWILNHLVVYDMRHRHFCATCLKEELQSLLWEHQQLGCSDGLHQKHTRTHATTSTKFAYHQRKLPILWTWGLRVALIVGIGVSLGIAVAVLQTIIQAALH
jgi:serine/threonine protein kinase